MARLKLYRCEDLKTGKVCEGNAKQMGDFLGCPGQMVYSLIARGIYKDRYKIELAGEYGEYVEYFSEQWKHVTKKLKESGYDLARIYLVEERENDDV